MLKQIIQLLIFYVLFIALSMGTIYIFDDKPNEMLGFALWGGIMYAVISFAPWLYMNLLIAKRPIDNNRNTKQWFAGLVILDVFAFFASAGSGKILIFIAMQIIYTASFLLGLVTTKLSIGLLQLKPNK